MLAVTVALLAILTILTWRIGGTMLFPPALFSSIWTVTLLCILLARDRFLAISDYACLIYLTGALAFSLGGVIALRVQKGRVPRKVVVDTRRLNRHVLDMLLVTLVVLFPYYLKVALKIAGTSNIIHALPAIRRRAVEAAGENLFGVVGNLNVLAILVSIALIYETDGTWSRRLRATVAVILALVYSAFTGSKYGAIFLITLFFVTQVKARKIRVATALVGVTIALSFFGGGVMLINLGGHGGKDVGATVNQVAKVISEYWLGSPIAFSEIAEKPDSLISSASIDRFPLEVGKQLGLSVRIPSINNPVYTPISGDGSSTNAYTIYLSYFKDYGWGGTVLLLATIAAVLTFLWDRAMLGRPVAVLMYGTLCTAIVQSIYSENFFVGLEEYLKAAGFFWLIYRFVPCVAEPLCAVTVSEEEVP